MKITKQHYNTLKTAMDKIINDDIKSDYKKADLSKTRFAWDIAYSSGLGNFIWNNLYEYLDGWDINTALLKIVGKY